MRSQRCADVSRVRSSSVHGLSTVGWPSPRGRTGQGAAPLGNSTGSRNGRWATVSHAVPMLRWLPAYRASNLGSDLLAGVIVAALLVPQSLGYAGIAGVPVQVGLYAVPSRCWHMPASARRRN